MFQSFNNEQLLVVLCMNGWSQVIAAVEFNCSVAKQGANHFLYLIYSIPLLNEWSSSKLYSEHVVLPLDIA